MLTALTEENRDRLAFEGLTSEAEGAALQDTCTRWSHTAREILPTVRSSADVYGRRKRYRAALSYDELCRVCFRNAKIQCILIDDGLGGVKEMERNISA